MIAATDEPLPPAIAALFRDPRHGRPLPSGSGAVHAGEAGREGEGTRVRFELGIVAGQVVAAGYRAYGCPYTLAICEWLARRLEGHELAAGLPDGPLDWARALPIPAERLGRLLVVEDALRIAWHAASQHVSGAV